MARLPPPVARPSVLLGAVISARFSRADATRLAIVATAIDTMMTPSDIQVEISGAHSMGSPSLMNGSSLTCIAWKTSLTPMKARMNAMP